MKIKKPYYFQDKDKVIRLLIAEVFYEDKEAVLLSR